jgi:tetratricopeptide (TPR) repeat protein
MRTTAPRRSGAPNTAIFLLLLVPSACGGVSEENRGRSQREYELAVSLYRDERNVRSALVALERSLQLDPENAEAHLLVGQLYGESELYERAEPHLRRAVELFTRLAADDPEKVARLDEAKNSLGAALVNLNRAQEALPILREVVADVHYQSPHLALGNLGMAYVALHQYTLAVEVLQRAVSVRPDFCVGQYRLGEAYLRLNDDAHALESLDRALNNPAQGCNRIQQALRARGEVHVHLHQPDAAREDFTRCRDLSPNSRDGQECASQLRTAEGP